MTAKSDLTGHTPESTQARALVLIALSLESMAKSLNHIAYPLFAIDKDGKIVRVEDAEKV